MLQMKSETFSLTLIAHFPIFPELLLNLHPFISMIRMLLTSLGVLAGSLLAHRVAYTTATMVATETRLPSYVTQVNMSAVCLEIASSVSSASGVFFNGPRHRTHRD